MDEHSTVLYKRDETGTCQTLSNAHHWTRIMNLIGSPEFPNLDTLSCLALKQPLLVVLNTLQIVSSTITFMSADWMVPYGKLLILCQQRNTCFFFLQFPHLVLEIIMREKSCLTIQKVVFSFHYTC
jgi:hypothetical protein